MVFLFRGSVWLFDDLKVDIVAPRTEKINHGNNGYVPVKNKFEMIMVIELSLTRSCQFPVPWISGNNNCIEKVSNAIISKALLFNLAKIYSTSGKIRVINAIKDSIPGVKGLNKCGEHRFTII